MLPRAALHGKELLSGPCCSPPLRFPPLQEAVEKAAAAAGPGADAAAEARRLTARRLQERGWLRAEDGAIYAPDQWAWMVTARRPRAAA